MSDKPKIASMVLDKEKAEKEADLRKEKISSFQKITDKMIATNDKAYSNRWWSRYYKEPLRDYTREDIERIINSGNIEAQKKLSSTYFTKDGFYKRIVTYYSTILKGSWILIPNPKKLSKITSPFLKRRYTNALNFVNEVMDLPVLFQNCALQLCKYGMYYGVISRESSDTFTILDLPHHFCSSNFKDLAGNNIIEFDIRYFDSISIPEDKASALSAYPKCIQRKYYEYTHATTKEEADPYMFIPTDIGVCFQLLDGTPPFLNVIPAAIDYDDAVQTERERDAEEIRKIIVQHIPHLNDGSLLFEPDEAEVMHQGAVGMMKNNPNVSVLTSYADVDAIVSKTQSDTANNNLEKMVNNIYYEAGTSSQLFSADSNLTLETSIKNDISLMMTFAHQFESFVSKKINDLFGNSNVTFKLMILPVSYYNEDKYVDNSFKLANSGYSFLVPAVAMGLSQSDLSNLKDLENDLLHLEKKLVPLQTAYTQSAETQAANGDSSVGRPELDDSEKSDKTLANERSLERQGGSNE